MLNLRCIVHKLSNVRGSGSAFSSLSTGLVHTSADLQHSNSVAMMDLSHGGAPHPPLECECIAFLPLSTGRHTLRLTFAHI